MKSLTITLLLFVGTMVTIPVYGASTREKLNALVDGLNDPDSIIRLATFEDAINSGDATLKRFALRTGMQSQDSDLRAMALRGAFVGLNLIAFKISENDELAAALAATSNDKKSLAKVKKDHKHSLALLFNYSVLPVQIEKYDFSTGNLGGFCLSNLKEKSEEYKVMGTVSGDEISLQVSCKVANYGNCTIKADMNSEGKLEGTIGCWHGSAKVELDLL